MPKRPRQHQLDSEGKDTFALLLPRQWAFIRQEPDYGIDGDIEVFDEEENSTGMKCHVQLKGTDEPDLSIALKYHLKKETFQYYRSLDLPVLMVRYHAPSKRCFVRWLHEYDPYYEKSKRKNRKTVTFTWSLSDAWNDGTPSSLETVLRLIREVKSPAFPWPMRFAIMIEQGEVYGFASGELSAAIRSEFSDNARHVLVVGDEERPHGRIHVSGHKIVVNIGTVVTTTFHLNKAYFARLDLKTLVADLLVLVAMTLVKARHLETAAKLFHRYVSVSGIVGLPQVSHLVFVAYRATHSIREALDFAELLHARGVWLESSLFELLGLTEASTLTEKAELLTYLEKRLSESIDSGDATAIATCHYNLGQFNRSMWKLRSAFRHYKLACRQGAFYWNRDYFCQELGGLLFDSHRYYLSVRLYERALQLGVGKDVIQPRLADALRFTGDYKQAEELLTEYLDGREQKVDDAHWRLLWFALRSLRTRLQIDHQQRLTAAARHTSSDSEMVNLDTRERIERLRTALALDAMCASAWNQLALAYTKERDERNAYECFLLAAMADHRYIDSWCNAIVYGALVNAREDNIEEYPVPAQWEDLLIAAYFFVGEKLIDVFATEFKTLLPAELYAKLLNALNDSFGVARRAKRLRLPFEVRFGQPDSTYKRIKLRE